MAKANIKWLKQSEGGRKQIPFIDEKCYLMVKIQEHEETFNWSLVIINLEKVGETETIADISFLMPDAPHHFLIPNAKFTVHQGVQIVGSGMIK